MGTFWVGVQQRPQYRQQQLAVPGAAATLELKTPLGRYYIFQNSWDNCLYADKSLHVLHVYLRLVHNMCVAVGHAVHKCRLANQSPPLVLRYCGGQQTSIARSTVRHNINTFHSIPSKVALFLVHCFVALLQLQRK